jgi:TP901 family phage tail tape measure protein
MNITVRVAAQQAQQQLKSMEGQLKTMSATASKMGGSGIAAMGNQLERFGKNLQWTGRQLEFNFTLPLVLAGAASTKWALANEKAMTRVRMVYGSAGEDQAKLKAETDALGKSFELLSSRFGVNQAKVIDIAAAWAEAGVAGVALAKSTRQTLEVMIIGNMDQEKAMTGLMAIQSAYKLNTTQLADALATLAGINKTGTIEFSGLIDVVQRAGSAARASGIDIQHLAAMANILTPAAGTASQAGNALRTMISRLAAPTKATVDILAMMGIEVQSFAWQSANGTQRIELLAKAFGNLSTSQKNLVSSVVASRWQVNRFDLLMEDINSNTGAYAKALNETKDPAKNLAVYAGMLTKYLSSQPEAFKILTTTIQNMMAKAIVPLLPMLAGVLSHIVALTAWFSKLDPGVQQLAISFLVLLAAVGPLVRYLGAFSTLLGVSMRGFVELGKILFGSSLIVDEHTIAVQANTDALLLNAGAEVAAGGAAETSAVGFWKANGIIGGLFKTFVQLLKFPWTVLMFLIDNVWAGIYAGGKIAIAAVQVIGSAFTAIPGVLTYIGGLIITVWEEMWTFLAAVTALGGELITTVITAEGGLGGLGAIFTGIGTFITGVWSAMWAAMLAITGIGGTALVEEVGAIPVEIGAELAAEGAVVAAAAASIPAALAVGIAAAVAVVGTAMFIFRKQIADALRWIVNGFFELPRAISGALQAVIRTLQTWAKAVQHYLSYLNPFARHSPSLIDNVKGGMEQVKGHYSGLKDVSGSISSAADAHKNFTQATAGGMAALDAKKYADQKADILDFSPGSGPAVDRMIAEITKLKAMLPGLQAEVDSQQKVTDAWSKALDNAKEHLADLNRQELPGLKASQDAIFANEQAMNQLRLAIMKVEDGFPSLDEAKNKLEKMKNAADALGSQLDYAKKQLAKFTDAPIAGMRAMDDAIFNNEIAAKKLRLEMLKMKEVNPQIADTASRLADLQGQIEGLQSKSQELRLAGAGSDILGPINDQIAGLRAQRVAIASQGTAYDQLQKQLDKLEEAGQRLDLERSIQFDPLTRQIQQLSDTTKEMPFDQIVAGINQWKPVVDELTVAHDEATAAMDRQQIAVDQLDQARTDATANLNAYLDALQRQTDEMNLQQSITFDPMVRAHQDEIDAAQKAVDMLQRAWDTENEKLTVAKNNYSDVEQQIRDMEQAMNDFAQAAAAAKSGSSLNEDLFAAGEGANFDIPGGTSTLGREGGLADIEQFNKDLQKELDDTLAGMGKIDMFKPIKDAWNGAWGWVKGSVGSVVGPVVDAVGGAIKTAAPAVGGFFKDLFSFNFDMPNIDFMAILRPIGDAFSTVGDMIDGSRFGGAMHMISDAMKVMVDSGERFIRWINEMLMPVIRDIGGMFSDAGKAIGDELSKWAPLFGSVGDAIGGLVSDLGTIAGALIGVVAYIVAPFVDLGKIIWDHLDPILTILSTFFIIMAQLIQVGLTAALAAWTVILPIFVNVIKPIFAGVVSIITGVLSVVRGVLSVFMGLLTGDWSLAWDGVIAIFEGAWKLMSGSVQMLVMPIIGFIKGVVEGIVGAFAWLADELVGHSIIPDLINGIIFWFSTLFDMVKLIWTAIGDIISFVWDHVIKPVWDAFKAAWDTVLQPLLGVMLFVFTAIFNAIGAALRFVWDHVIQPVWDLFKAVWTTVLQPAMSVMLMDFTVIFNAVGTALRWAWDNLLKPVWDFFVNVWNNVLSRPMGFLRDSMKGIFDAIGTGLRWVWDNVVQPVWNLFKGIWDTLRKPMESLRDGFKTIFDGIGNGIKAGINLGIDAINFLIKGINKISDIVPGIDFHIDLIPKLAAGGMVPEGRVGGGFKTNGPRAIVGEGNPLYPEYVIPTDPTYRDRARGLLDAATAALYRTGGVLPGSGTSGRAPETGAPWDRLTDAISHGVGLIRKGAATAAMAPLLKLADAVIDKIPWEFAKKFMRGMKNKIYDWARGVEDKVPEDVAPKPSDFGTGYEGGSISQLIDMMNHSGIPYRVTSTYRPGDPGYHGQHRAVDFAGPTPSRDSDALLAIDRYMAGFSGSLKELIYAGPGGVSFKNGSPFPYDAMTRADHHDHVHTALAAGGTIPWEPIYAAAEGAYVRASQDGSLLRVGEGGHDELVQPLPHDFDGMGKKEYHFHGNLEFPNIKSGKDAKTFLDNLESLVD